MKKQGQFQVDNFDKFHNGDLGSDLERVITTAESLYENDESLSISKDFEESFDYPFGICVEGTSYWYANEDERNEDCKLLVGLVADYCIFNYSVKDFKGKYNPGDKILEIFHKEKLIHTESISDVEDCWLGLSIDDTNMDFNFYKYNEKENKFCLTMYPTNQDSYGLWHTNSGIFSRIKVEIETK